MEIVRRADRYIVNPVRLPLPSQFLKMTVETLEFRKECRVEEERIEHAYGIMWIEGGDEAGASFPDGGKGPRRHVPSHAGNCEVPNAVLQFHSLTPGHGILESRTSARLSRRSYWAVRTRRAQRYARDRMRLEDSA